MQSVPVWGSEPGPRQQPSGAAPGAGFAAAACEHCRQQHPGGLVDEHQPTTGTQHPRALNSATSRYGGTWLVWHRLVPLGEAFQIEQLPSGHDEIADR
jgi:hypothetical protein